jgi:hypothetical protein
MTRTDILRLIAAVGWLVATALIGAERGIVRRLRRKGAVDPASAVSLHLRSPLTRLRLARLLNAGAVASTDPERVYLDADGYLRYRHARRRRALTVLAIALPLIAALWWLSTRQRVS